MINPRFRSRPVAPRLGAVLLLLASLAAVPLLGAEARRGEVLVIRVDTVIHPVAVELVQDAVREADAAGAAALVVEINTPGGLMSSTREITTAMLGARTPVVAYVAPGGAQAASAGFFILMAADVAAMAPGTNAGAAHPVDGGGGDIPGVMGEKAAQDAAANIRALAARNGRNPELAQAAVLESRSFTADEAVRARLADLVAPSLPRLLEALDGRRVRRGETVVTLRTAGAPVRNLELSPFRRFLGVLATPDIAYILLTLGFLGLYFELTTPGAILPGVIGGICLLLGFFALSVLPVNYAGLGLLFLAMIFFIAEIKVVSHGMLAVAGVISMVLGSLMLFKSPDPALRVSLELIATLALFSLAVVGFLIFMARRALRAPVRTGREGLVHEVGTARSDLAPHGKIFVHGEIWEAVAEEPVRAGEPVEIVGIRDLVLAVRPYRGASSASSASSDSTVGTARLSAP
ncbi:MAG TPA: nodulation protein NfeD [Thermoanaerobaculia bacterium]|nr:nodulation protein NfeD [Thermoanaerobaculia bacterium]